MKAHSRLASKLALAALFALLCLRSLAFAAQEERYGLISAVDAVGFTVSDMDRSVAFFADVLSFEKLSDIEVADDRYEHLEGVFGLRMRVVRMRRPKTPSRCSY